MLCCVTEYKVCSVTDVDFVFCAPSQITRRVVYIVMDNKM